jgi:hypothetical protein
MKLGTVCTGIGGIDLGFHRAGFTPAFMCEIDEDCRNVLRRHFPGVPLFKDMREIGKHNLPPVDVLAGGTPCQGFSLAGLRGSLSDDRSNLCLQFCRIADELEPAIIVWENVPGVLWWEQMPHSFRQDQSTAGASTTKDGTCSAGRTRVWLLDPGAPQRGAFSTVNGSAWPNDASVCSLSQILEPVVPRKYFLSPKACAGILRRAEKRGKELPPHLKAALMAVAAAGEPTSSVGED